MNQSGTLIQIAHTDTPLQLSVPKQSVDEERGFKTRTIQKPKNEPKNTKIKKQAMNLKMQKHKNRPTWVDITKIQKKGKPPMQTTPQLLVTSVRTTEEVARSTTAAGQSPGPKIKPVNRWTGGMRETNSGIAKTLQKFRTELDGQASTIAQ